MGLHVNLEHGGLSACLECGMLIVDGEEGCITYATNLLKQLEEELTLEEIRNLNGAYQLQHYQHYALDDLVAAKIIVELFAFSNNIEDIEVEEVANRILEESFFYQRNIETSITIDMLEGAKGEKRIQLMNQYIQEVVARYADYHELIAE